MEKRKKREKNIKKEEEKNSVADPQYINADPDPGFAFFRISPKDPIWFVDDFCSVLSSWTDHNLYIW